MNRHNSNYNSIILIILFLISFFVLSNYCVCNIFNTLKYLHVSDGHVKSREKEIKTKRMFSVRQR